MESLICAWAVIAGAAATPAAISALRILVVDKCIDRSCDVRWTPIRTFEDRPSAYRSRYPQPSAGRASLRRVQRRGREPVPFALEQLREPPRRAGLEIGADRLQADRQAAVVEPGRERRGRQAAEDRDLGVEGHVETRDLAAVDHERPLPQRVVAVPEGRARERRRDEHVPFGEERGPRA